MIELAVAHQAFLVERSKEAGLSPRKLAGALQREFNLGVDEAVEITLRWLDLNGR